MTTTAAATPGGVSRRRRSVECSGSSLDIWMVCCIVLWRRWKIQDTTHNSYYPPPSLEDSSTRAERSGARQWMYAISASDDIIIIIDGAKASSE